MSETVTAAGVRAWLLAFADAVAAHRDELTELDAAIGDADHGTNMDRGMRAVADRLTDDPGGPAALCKLVGMTLISTVGGAAGPLYGTFFLELGKAAGERTELGVADWAAAFQAGVDGVQRRGKAEAGDKTMLDALLPAAAALRAAGGGDALLDEALLAAAEAAARGMKATVPLVARKGRASYLGERSAGHQDPGATSSWLLLETAAGAMGGSASGAERAAGAMGGGTAAAHDAGAAPA